MQPSRLFTFALLLLPALPALADSLGLAAGASYWYYDLSGTARYRSSNPADDINLRNDLGYGSDQVTSVFVRLEQPVPMVPNIRLAVTDLDSSANGRLSRSVSYGGRVFSASEAVASHIRLNQADVTLYYSPLDNWVDLDLGIDAKRVELDVDLDGSLSGHQSAHVQGWVPMLYAGVGADLPLTGLSLGLDGAWIGYQGSRFYDYRAEVRYRTPWRVGVQAGYRAIRLDLNDFDGASSNLEFSGPYAGLHLAF